jgi:hypothetical protein
LLNIASFPHKERAIELKTTAMEEIGNIRNGIFLEFKDEALRKEMTMELWVNILYKSYLHRKFMNKKNCELLGYFFQKRVVDFWLSIETKDVNQVETEIISQANLLRKKILSMN